MTSNWSYYGYDMTGVDLGDALRVAAYDPLASVGIHSRYEGRLPICGWTDTVEPVSGRAAAADAPTARTLILWTASPDEALVARGAGGLLPAASALTDLRKMVEDWLAACRRTSDYPPAADCDGSTSATHRVVHPNGLGVWAHGALVAIQPAWAYYHK